MPALGLGHCRLILLRLHKVGSQAVQDLRDRAGAGPEPGLVSRAAWAEGGSCLGRTLPPFGHGYQSFRR